MQVKIKTLSCVLAASLVISGTAVAHDNAATHAKIRKGATAMTWLTNPDNAKHGTKRSRARAKARAFKTLMDGLKSIGFYHGAVCVHGGEGAWNSNTGNGYYGGMQMDLTFQRSYGLLYLNRWGTANNWPVWTQLYVSYRAWASGRGWYPWPKTARYCGLI